MVLHSTGTRRHHSSVSVIDLWAENAINISAGRLVIAVSLSICRVRTNTPY